MSKLTLDALKSRANTIASNKLLNSISGGTTNDYHPSDYEVKDEKAEVEVEVDGTYVRQPRIRP